MKIKASVQQNTWSSSNLSFFSLVSYINIYIQRLWTYSMANFTCKLFPFGSNQRELLFALIFSSCNAFHRNSVVMHIAHPTSVYAHSGWKCMSDFYSSAILHQLWIWKHELRTLVEKYNHFCQKLWNKTVRLAASLFSASNLLLWLLIYSIGHIMSSRDRSCKFSIKSIMSCIGL